MTAGYVMNCTVCNSNFSNVEQWNHHLVSDVHQESSKGTLSEWDKEIRKCAITVYASFSMAAEPDALGVVTNFTSTTTLVTDFVISASRPRVAILQFESRRKVDEVFGPGASQKCNNQLIQLRRLGDYLELEWIEFMTLFLDDHMVDRITYGSQNGNGQEQIIIATIASCSLGGTLNSQLRSILSQVEIPEDEWNIVQEVLQEITLLLRTLTQKQINLSLYRNNHLKLRNNNSSNTYLVFIYYFVRLLHGFELPPKGIWELAEEKISSKSHQKPSILSHLTVLGDKRRKRLERELGRRILHNKSGTIFKFTGSYWAMEEYQLSRLLEYYCRFDLRVKSLLGILYYWAAVNKITLSEGTTGPIAYCTSPNPVGLEWLLLFFLYYQEKVLPVPATILERPHKRLTVGLGRHVNLGPKVDLGFDDDPAFPQQWQKNKNVISEDSEEFSFSVIKMLQKFMAFCSEKLVNSCLLNTRDGELLHPGDTVGIDAYQHVLTDMQKDHVKRIAVFHPFYHPWKVGITSKKWFDIVIPAMKKTARRLDKFLDNHNKQSETIRNGAEELQSALDLNI